MVSNHGAKQNDSAQDPLVYPGWGKEDYSTQPTIKDRVIPSRESNREKESSNTGTSCNINYAYFISYVFQIACLGKLLHDLERRVEY